MRKDVTLLEAIAMGGNVYDWLGVDRETKTLKKRVSTVGNLAIKEDVIEETIEEHVVEISPIDKPSDRFDIYDYILYREYMIANGGVPSIEDYFKAIEYYKSRA